MEVDERVGPGGEVRKPLDVASARAAIEHLRELGCESVAVCFLHSYANADHELAVGAMLEGEFPFVSLSCRVLPEVKEYERTATTVVDAYVKPVVSRYLGNLRAQSRRGGRARAAARDAVERRRLLRTRRGGESGAHHRERAGRRRDRRAGPRARRPGSTI